MIVTGLLSVIKLILKAIFSGISIPNVSSFDDLLNIIENAFNYGLPVLNFVFPIKGTILILLPVSLALHYFEEIYSFGEWLYNKIPFIH